MFVEMMERKIRLRTVNEHITCGLCKGYLIDATTITECLHTFCKSCLVRFLEENNTCPKCQNLIHQSYPLNYISFDRTMQDIVYKLVPNLQEKENAYKSPKEDVYSVDLKPLQEMKKQQDYYKKIGKAPPNSSPAGNTEEIPAEGEKSLPPPDEDQDCHRSDEQVHICLECKGNHMRHLKKKYIRISSQATITHLKKFIALKVYHARERYKDVDILCNEELLGKDHTLKFVSVTRWRSKDTPLTLHYRQRITEL